MRTECRTCKLPIVQATHNERNIHAFEGIKAGVVFKAGMLLIAAATSYKSFKDVSGDPEALARDYIVDASRKSFDALRQA